MPAVAERMQKLRGWLSEWASRAVPLISLTTFFFAESMSPIAMRMISVRLYDVCNAPKRDQIDVCYVVSINRKEYRVKISTGTVFYNSVQNEASNLGGEVVTDGAKRLYWVVLCGLHKTVDTANSNFYGKVGRDVVLL